ncbi:MAG: T9SS type A sorting domain-containing protein [Cytophagaceae bacterium]|nr:T9SS type A sorting domain-containing protein [Cytophagaceae bacterium]
MPYSINWTTTAGTHSITAKATDNKGAATTSAAISVTVNAPTNTPPTESITSPANNFTTVQGTVVAISATATDADGISKVEFLVDGTKIGEDQSTPYTFNWTAASGTHSLTAKATDTKGAAKTSSVITITVNSNNTCTVAAWTSGKVYIANDKASQNGKIYRAKWWTQGQSPATNSGQWDVWELVGNCGAKMGMFEPDASAKIIDIYPNPTNGYSMLKLNIADIESAEVIIINSLGLEVYRGKLNADLQADIYLHEAEAGIYTIRIISCDNIWTEKLVKQ